MRQYLNGLKKKLRQLDVSFDKKKKATVNLIKSLRGDLNNPRIIKKMEQLSNIIAELKDLGIKIKLFEYEMELRSAA